MKHNEKLNKIKSKKKTEVKLRVIRAHTKTKTADSQGFRRMGVTQLAIPKDTPSMNKLRALNDWAEVGFVENNANLVFFNIDAIPVYGNQDRLYPEIEDMSELLAECDEVVVELTKEIRSVRDPKTKRYSQKKVVVLSKIVVKDAFNTLEDENKYFAALVVDKVSLDASDDDLWAL